MKSLADAITDFLGLNFDPQGGALPVWKPKTKPSVALPQIEKKPGNAVPVRIGDNYTEEELEKIAAMSEHEFGRIRHLFGHHKTPADFLAEYRKQQQARNTETIVDFNAQTFDTNGLTARDYGELLAYQPPLCDGSPESLAIAAAVKFELQKTNFKKHAAIFDKLKPAFKELTIQKIKHYSSAFQRAKND